MTSHQLRYPTPPAAPFVVPPPCAHLPFFVHCTKATFAFRVGQWRRCKSQLSSSAQGAKPGAKGCMHADLNCARAPKSGIAAEIFINDAALSATVPVQSCTDAPSSSTTAAPTPTRAPQSRTPAPNRGRRPAPITKRAVPSVIDELANCIAAFPSLDQEGIQATRASPRREQPQPRPAGRCRRGDHARQQLTLGVHIQDAGVHKA
jgi:hypothetical protein